MKNLEQYFRESQNYNAIDHALRATCQNNKVSFYIHPSGMNGATIDYEVVGDTIVPISGINMTYGQATAVIKAGKKACREGWNGKGMWIAYQNGVCLVAESFWNRHSKEFAENNGGHADVLPYIIMKTADGKILMGWAPNQIDALAEDWMIAE